MFYSNFHVVPYKIMNQQINLIRITINTRTIISRLKQICSNIETCTDFVSLETAVLYIYAFRRQKLFKTGEGLSNNGQKSVISRVKNKDLHWLSKIWKAITRFRM